MDVDIRTECRKEHHHKSKHKKHKHKEKEKYKCREAAERDKEVGSDVESGEIRSDLDLGDLLRAAPSAQQEDDRCTDSIVVHRAAGVSPMAAEDRSPTQGGRGDQPVASSSPAGTTGGRDAQAHANPRKRERMEVDATNGKAGSRGRKESRRGVADCGPDGRDWSSREEADRPWDRDCDRRDREPRRQKDESCESERERQRERARARERERTSAGDDRRVRRDRNKERDRHTERDHHTERERHTELERHTERERERDTRSVPGGLGDRLARPDDNKRRTSRERSKSPHGRRDEGWRRGQSCSPNRGDRVEHGRDTYRAEREREWDKGGRRDKGRGTGRGSFDAKSPERHDDAAGLALDDDGVEEARIEREREERRRRQRAILQRHAQQQVLTEAVVAPTATALATASLTGYAAATPSQGAPRSPAGLVAEAVGAGPLRHVANASNIARSAPDTPGPAPGDGGEGDRTPEGEATSSSEASDINADGPVMDIFGAEQVAADDADSGASMAAAAEDAERERQRHAAALLQQEQLQPEQEAGASTDVARVLGRGADHAHGKGIDGVPTRRSSAGTGEGVSTHDEDDMFAEKDDDDDMFAADVSDALNGGQQAAARAAPAGGAAQLHDSYDDAEGYYNFQIGEVLEGRYEVTEFKGKGVFSNVMRARDLGVGRAGASGSGGEEVAIKVIRANETMYKAAQTEQAILRKLCSSDPDNRKHCIRLLRAFEFRKHMCLVFEPMDMNLRDLTKKYGRNKGLNVTAVGMYTAQLLVALRHLRKNEVLHADVKPDNILVNARRTKVKLCDFGSAMLAGDNEVTPYLVSRFYRAPEVILGMKYEHAMDMWSVGCVVYELFTGNILFPGRTNNEMVKLMMDVKGPFTKKMLRRCAFADKHFDLNEPSAPFIFMEEDTLTKKPVRRMVNVQAAKQNFSQLLGPALRGAKPEDRPQIQLLADLLEKMMALEPDKRIDTDAAMRHPFVRSFLPKKHEGHHRLGHGDGSVPL